MLDRAMELTRRYVIQRRQFGQTLASYQGVQFQLTDAEIERNGLAELAKYSLWTTLARPQDAIDDALALRVAALEAAETVFRVAHQLHGAIGFCDDMPLSWLSRYSQPLRRLPWGLSATREHLIRRVDKRGLYGLFDSTESFYPATYHPAEQGATHDG
jgi:3-oxo-4-pregnene-20-carboxyl-CoA dehydrogenase alpha subunit